jgi:hypothetical protein
VLQGGIEPPASPLPRECSTTELLQHPKRVLKSAGLPAIGAMSRQGVIVAAVGLVRRTRTGPSPHEKLRRSLSWESVSKSAAFCLRKTESMINVSYSANPSALFGVSRTKEEGILSASSGW